MQDTTSELILQELQLLRSDFNEFARDTGERVATLESHVKQGIVGNGQPSRLQALETTVTRLLEWRWWVVGAAAGGGAVISCVAWMAELALKGR